MRRNTSLIKYYLDIGAGGVQSVTVNSTVIGLKGLSLELFTTGLIRITEIIITNLVNKGRSTVGQPPR